MKGSNENAEARERVASALAQVAEVEAATADSYSPRLRAEWRLRETRRVARVVAARVAQGPQGDEGFYITLN